VVVAEREELAVPRELKADSLADVSFERQLLDDLQILVDILQKLDHNVFLLVDLLTEDLGDLFFNWLLANLEGLDPEVLVGGNGVLDQPDHVVKVLWEDLGVDDVESRDLLLDTVLPSENGLVVVLVLGSRVELGILHFFIHLFFLGVPLLLCVELLANLVDLLQILDQPALELDVGDASLVETLDVVDAAVTKLLPRAVGVFVQLHQVVL